MKKEGRKGGGGVMKEDGEGIREKVRGIGREEDNKVNLHFSGGENRNPLGKKK